MTFLGNPSENNRNLYAIPGMDYVSHEDIIPYSTREKTPIQHELFERFLAPRLSPDAEPDEVLFDVQPPLVHWQEKNHPWLALSDVHKETTEKVRVTVIPFYMGSKEAQGSHVYWVNFFYFESGPQ